MDAEQSDVAASRGGVRGGVSVRARGVGEPYGGGLTVAAIALDALDGHLARKKKWRRRWARNSTSWATG